MLHRENEIVHYHTSSAADLLREVMEHYHVTQEDLAERIGVSQKNVSDILNRKRYLTAAVALRVEKVTGISSQLLLQLDVNYRLHQAREFADEPAGHAEHYLKRYDWVIAG